MAVKDYISLGIARRKIPFVQQLTATDCGAACLAMILRYYGRTVSLSELRTATGSGRDGSSARQIIEVAGRYHLEGNLIELRAEDLNTLSPGAMLFWKRAHFVVLERATAKGFWIVDPAKGRQFLASSDAQKSFSGVAVVLKPTNNWRRGKDRELNLWRYASPVLKEWRLLARILAVSLVVSGLSMSTPLLLAWLFDRVLPRNDYGLLNLLGLGLLAVVGFHFLTSICRARLLLNLRTRLDSRMMREFLEHLVNLQYSFFETRSRGDLVLRLNTNSEVREILTSSALSTLLDSIFILVNLAVLFTFSRLMLMIAAVLGLIQICVLLFARGPQKRLTSNYLQAQARSQNYQIDMLSGIETLKSMGRQRHAVEKWAGLFDDQLQISVVRGRLSAFVDCILNTVRLATPLVLAWFGATEVLAGKLSLGAMVGLVSVGSGFLGPLSGLVGTALRVSTVSSYLERMADVLATPRERAGGIRPEVFTGAATLDNVTFSYSPGGPPVLKEVNVQISAGMLVGIVGPSGAGKSTLIRLLMGLYEPQRGQVLFDNLPLNTLDIDHVRQRIGHVPQKSQLFGLTLLENATFGDENVPRETVERALQFAKLYEDICRMPLGLWTVLADGGASLSGGQRQRLAIARALVHEPKLLILDEATNSLDTRTEEAVFRELEKLNCTRVVIAHRLSTIRNADLILVLDRGEIVDRGTHDELIARPGLYRDLIRVQAEGQYDAHPKERFVQSSAR